MVGGYQIIDLQNKEFTNGVGIVYEGIYDLLEGTRKTTLVTNINYDGGEMKDRFIDFVPVGSQFVADINIAGMEVQITVQDTDVVTFVEV